VKSSPPTFLLAAIVALSAIASSAAPAVAQEANELVLPEPIDGYLSEQIGPVLWTYPEAMRERVAPLIDEFDDHWRSVVNDFGIIVDDQLEIRVARNPGEMRELAPVGAPPPEYATGVAYPRWGVILLTMSAPQTWEPPDLEVVLVHELSHVAFYRAVSGNAVPLWFKEGVAIHQSEVRMLPRMESLLRAAAQRSMLRLSELDKHALRNGDTFDTALGTAYGWTRIGLERQWRESLRTRYRIMPALFAGSTVWVLAAVLVVVAYRKRRRYHHMKLEQMAYREQLEAVPDPSVPPPPPLAAREGLTDTGVPIVEHDGESHTLH